MNVPFSLYFTVCAAFISAQLSLLLSLSIVVTVYPLCFCRTALYLYLLFVLNECAGASYNPF